MTTFGAELKRAMTRRGGTIKAAAVACGITEANMHHYRRGRQWPSVDTAARMAEVLDAPALATLALSHRTRPCASCGTTFVDSGHGGPIRRFCSTTCGDRDFNRRVRKPQRHRQAVVDHNDLAVIRAAVAAHCGTCTLGESICRDAECDLRGVSPLPFVPMSQVRRRVA